MIASYDRVHIEDCPILGGDRSSRLRPIRKFCSLEFFNVWEYSILYQCQSMIEIVQPTLTDFTNIDIGILTCELEVPIVVLNNGEIREIINDNHRFLNLLDDFV
jgi:hypothetical protein